MRASIAGRSLCSFDGDQWRWEMATVQQICPVRHEVNVVLPRAVRVVHHSVEATLRPLFGRARAYAVHRVLEFALTLHKLSLPLGLPERNVVHDVLFFQRLLEQQSLEGGACFIAILLVWLYAMLQDVLLLLNARLQ